MTVEEIVDTIGNKLDELGEELSKEEWRDACEQLATNCEMKAEAAREELEDEVES